MNQTKNYQLSQWDAEDRIIREDFNSDNDKIDAALAALVDANDTIKTMVADQASSLSQFGNCQVYISSYTGTGTYGSTGAVTLSFSYPPRLVVVAESSTGMSMHAVYGTSGAYVRAGAGFASVTASWGTRTFSWYSSSASNQLNVSGTTYIVVAFLQKDT